MLFRNIIILLFLLLIGVLAVYVHLKTLAAPVEEEEEAEGLDALVEYIKVYFNDLLDVDNRTNTLNKKAKLQREKEKSLLLKALRNCSHGDYRAKELVKKHIKDWLLNGRQISSEEIEEIIPFTKPNRLKASDKFEILLYLYTKEYGFEAANELLSDLLNTHLVNRDLKNSEVNTAGSAPADETLELQDQISSEDVCKLYSDYSPYLDFDDRLNLLTNFIYRKYKGHGIIDSLRDQNIDGVSAGVSGVIENDGLLPAVKKEEWDETQSPETEGRKNFESVWVFYHGNMIRLSFMSFESEAELERVCKNVYRYNNPGQLSAAKGYVANEMKDGSRVVVVRPPFSEGWAFFIRKFGTGGVMSVEELITDQGSDKVISLLKYIIAGCQVFAITGEQGCGKTTMLKALIEFIPKNLTLRIQELVFELHLRREYPDRNIVSFKETAEVSGRDGLDLQKKTDGTVNIIGEVASSDVAGWLVMVSQVASRFSIFTHHAKTTESLISAMRNDLMLSSGFNNEEVAELQVRQAIRFDVHMVRLPDGSRKIQRITEIGKDKKRESTRVIISLTENGYEYINPISENTQAEMLQMMSREVGQEFTAYNKNCLQGGQK